MSISGRFVAVLAVGVIPVVLFGYDGDAAAIALVCWLAAAVLAGIVDLALAASPRRVALQRSLPARVRLGETVTGVLHLTNTGSRRLTGRVRDAWQPSAGSPSARIPVSIPPGERRTVRIPLTPTRRGERTVDHVTIRSSGPLGLWSRQATLAAPGRIRVLPPFHARRHLPSRLARLRELDGATSVLVRGQGTEFDSLREYVRGDDVRSIDWRATARRTDPDSGMQPRLMVRTWRPERDRRVILVTDTGRTSAARIADEPRIDTAFEASLLLAALADRAGDRVDFLAYDRRVRGRVRGASGGPLLSSMVDAMAVIDPELIEMDWAAIPGQLDALTRRRALVVLLTSIDTPAAGRGLLAVLPQLTLRHTVVVASVTDPAVTGAIRQRDDREGVYRAAAAERALLDTARVAAAVGRLGAEVVLGSPAELPPALADRYLALKAAGLL